MQTQVKTTLKSLTVVALLSAGADAAAQSRGVVTGIRVSDAEVVAGTPITMTIAGSNPCGAVFIDQRDGTAVTYPIERVPTTQSYTYTRPGTYRIIARGTGNCDGEVVTDVTVLPRGAGRTDASVGRFRNMDTDRDGVVTRAEWRGSAQAFRNNDRNGDGVLSGDEVRDPDEGGETIARPAPGQFAERRRSTRIVASHVRSGADHDEASRILTPTATESLHGANWRAMRHSPSPRQDRPLSSTRCSAGPTRG